MGLGSFFLVFAGCAYVASAAATCDLPFEDFGGKCLFINNLSHGPWADMKQLCKFLGADLVKLDNASVFADIVSHIVTSGISPTSFWIGATDEEVEGVWKWTDGAIVTMGTPFWSLTGSSCTVQEPKGGTGQNCALLNSNKSYFFDDAACSTQAAVICEK